MTAAAPLLREEPYQGTPRTVAEMYRVGHGPRGSKSWTVRRWAEETVRRVRPRDYWSEVLAVYYRACGPEFRYTRDPLRVELVKSPEVLLQEIAERGVACGDCDDLATFLIAATGAIGARSRIVTVGFTPVNGARPDPRILADPVFRLVSSAHPRLPGPFSHVFTQSQRMPGWWVTLDPVAGPRTKQMHGRIKQARIYTETE